MAHHRRDHQFKPWTGSLLNTFDTIARFKSHPHTRPRERVNPLRHRAYTPICWSARPAGHALSWTNVMVSAIPTSRVISSESSVIASVRPSPLQQAWKFNSLELVHVASSRRSDGAAATKAPCLGRELMISAMVSHGYGRLRSERRHLSAQSSHIRASRSSSARVARHHASQIRHCLPEPPNLKFG